MNSVALLLYPGLGLAYFKRWRCNMVLEISYILYIMRNLHKGMLHEIICRWLRKGMLIHVGVEYLMSNVFYCACKSRSGSWHGRHFSSL